MRSNLLSAVQDIKDWITFIFDFTNSIITSVFVFLDFTLLFFIFLNLATFGSDRLNERNYQVMHRPDGSTDSSPQRSAFEAEDSESDMDDDTIKPRGY